jgi:hypothetical protein
MEKIKQRIYFFFLIYFLFNSNINFDYCSGCKIEGILCTHINDILESYPSNCRLNVVNRICTPCGEIGRGDYYIFNENQCHQQQIAQKLYIILSNVLMNALLAIFYWEAIVIKDVVVI